MSEPSFDMTEVSHSSTNANAQTPTTRRTLTFQVNSYDLREATHDEAVEIIRNADTPVRYGVV